MSFNQSFSVCCSQCCPSIKLSWYLAESHYILPSVGVQKLLQLQEAVGKELNGNVLILSGCTVTGAAILQWCKMCCTWQGGSGKYSVFPQAASPWLPVVQW